MTIGLRILGVADDVLSLGGAIVQLSGIRATARVGLLAPQGDAEIALTGIRSTASVGQLLFVSEPVQVVLSGARATARVGSLFLPTIVDVPDARVLDVEPIDRTIIVIGDDDS